MPEFSFREFITEPPKIPLKCKDCRVQRELYIDLGYLIVEKLQESNEADALMDKNRRLFDPKTGETLDSEAEVHRRIELGDNLEALDEQIDDKRRQIDANSDACGGVLELQASKDGVDYAITICRSPFVIQVDSPTPSNQPVRIRATRATEL